MTTFETPDGYISFGRESNCNLDICDIQYSFYSYRPSLTANATLLSLFAVLLVTHTYIGIRYKAWGFMIGMQLGCIAEIIGYIGRIRLHKNPFAYSPFILQTICLTIAPIFYTASIHVTLSKTILHYAPDMSRCKPRLFLLVLLSADIICVVFQSTGSALYARSPEDSKGNVISQSGLSFQLAVLVGFIAAFTDFIIRFLRSGRLIQMTWRLRAFLTGLYASVFLIIGRCAFRIAELKGGYRVEMIKHEVPFIVFEGVFIFLSAFALCWGHPGLALKPEDAALHCKENGYISDFEHGTTGRGTGKSRLQARSTLM